MLGSRLARLSHLGDAGRAACRPSLSGQAWAAWRSRRGATALEFAFTGVLLLALLVGILQVGRYLTTLAAVRTVAADAVRLTILRGSANLNAGAAACSNLSGNLTGANARASVLQGSALSVVLSGCATSSGVTTVTVTVTYPFTYSIPLVPGGTLQLRETATAIIT
ncbi:TadE/TadG family type IV pilus assembly protein [Pararoseomonas indoligenes]|uniref:Pilus assembly protein n=1 Tax=Roseomonas indoligenes TaxID=2820811 RepID=A0A940MXF9_9PROT|nr:TadE/TadG family type IV pilus assembly protein [Pararoseomonas indoligenes]MBP0493881.1 pilus assembly protein [Pararoseomonas indoligenes]